MTTRFAVWDADVVQQVADVLGETSTGLTGPEIGHLLAALIAAMAGRVARTRCEMLPGCPATSGG